MQFLQKERWMGMEEIVAETTSRKKKGHRSVCPYCACKKRMESPCLHMTQVLHNFRKSRS